MTITFTVPGDPVAWARSRHRGAHHFTAKKQRDHASIVASYALEARPRGFALLAGPLELVVVAQFRRTRTCRNKYDPHDTPAGVTLEAESRWWHPTNKRLDGDNIAKQVADAIMGVLILDDGGIVAWTIQKVCSDDEPCTVVTVRSLG